MYHTFSHSFMKHKKQNKMKQKYLKKIEIKIASYLSFPMSISRRPSQAKVLYLSMCSRVCVSVLVFMHVYE